MREWGIKTRVLVLTLIPTIAISILLAIYFTSARLGDLEDGLRDRGYAFALQLAPISEYGVFSGNLQALQRIANRALDEGEVRAVSIFNKEGRLLAHAGHKMQLPTNIRSVSNRTNGITMADTGNSLLFTAPITMRDAIIEDFPDDVIDEEILLNYLNPQEDVIGWISIEFGRMSTKIRQYQVLIACSIIVSIGLCISGIIAFRMARDVTQPILKITDVVEKIKDGNLDTRVYTGAKGELSRLESGINTMAASLKCAHEEMQQCVEQATADLRQTLETIEIQNIELEMARREAETASQIKSDFLANMSHEIRTPLNGVIGFINLLMRTQLNKNQYEYLRTIQKSANNLMSIINDILDFSKIEAGKLNLDYSDMDLRECIEDALTLMAPAAHEKGLELIPMIYSDVPTHVIGDSLRIKQVVTNLVNNAVKFTEKGHIVIRTMLEKESDEGLVLCISITDTGIGLTDEDQEHLFQAFRQADATTTRKYGGTGLGLVISKRLIQQMGGDIGVESAKGKGATFWFTFRTERVLDVVEDNNTLLRGHNVLIYDPIATMRFSLSHILESWGINVTIAENEIVLSQLVFNKHFDLIFIGGNQPSAMDDPMYAMLRQIKQHQSSPVVALLNTSESYMHDMLFDSGLVQHTLVKPIKYQKLKQIASEALIPDYCVSKPIFRTTPLEKLAIGQHGIHVLAVDDYDPNLKLVKALLEDMHIQVTTATSGREAIEHFKKERFDLILMDIQMPEMDGVEAANHIRNLSPPDQRTPIIALTAHALLSQREQLLASGLDDYLSKPVSERELQALIFRWVKQSNMQNPALLISPQKQKQLTASKPMVYDEALAIKRVSGNQALATELFLKLKESIKEDLPMILNAYQCSEWKLLRERIHRLHGATCYCGTSELQECAASLEKTMINKNMENIAQDFDKFIKACDRVLQHELELMQA